MNKNTLKGFTLTELLVVIAIIGILAVIVVASLGDSRIKAKDAAIVTETNSLLTAIELETGATGNYTGVCTMFNTGNALDYIKDSIENHGGIWESCTDDTDSYAVVITLNAAQAYSPYAKQAYARGNTTICHDKTVTMSVEADLQEHLDHGDYKGACVITPAVEYQGVHSDDKKLLTNEDIKYLRDAAKEGGDKFDEPKYYCVGSVPPRVDGGNFRKGYLYEVPVGGCGSPAPSATETNAAYAGRE